MNLLARLRPVVEKAFHDELTSVLEESFPRCIFFLSMSDGNQRATVYHACAAEFGKAWQLLEAECHKLSNAVEGSIKWLKVDWVTKVEALTWQELNTTLEKTKRNYYRKGIALDENFTTALLEQELNANAVLYAAPDVLHAQLNQQNLATYLKNRFGRKKRLVISPNDPVFVFQTRALFINGETGTFAFDDPEAPIRAMGTGQNTGRRTTHPMEARHVYGHIAELSAHLGHRVQPDGKFHYGWFPCFGRNVAGYSLYHHALALLSMIEAWDVTRSPELLLSLEKGMDAILKRCKGSDNDAYRVWVDNEGSAQLATQAVLLLVLTHHAEVTGKSEHAEVRQGLAASLLTMQKANQGDFYAQWDIARKAPTSEATSDTASWQAITALLSHYRMQQAPSLLEAAIAGVQALLDNGTSKKHDHWQAICLAELIEYRQDSRYFDHALDNLSTLMPIMERSMETLPGLLQLCLATARIIDRISALPHLRHQLADFDLKRFFEALHFRGNHMLNGVFWPELAMYFQHPHQIAGSSFIRIDSFRVRIDDVANYLSGFIQFQRFLSQGGKRLPLSFPHTEPKPIPAPTSVSPYSTVRHQRQKPLQVLFMNEDFGEMRSGIENAALLRKRIFQQHLDLQPIFVTMRHRTNSHELYQNAIKNGVLEEGDPFINLYDQLQGFDKLKPEEASEPHFNFGESLRVEEVPDTPGDLRVYDQHGNLVMYMFVSRETHKLLFINYMSGDKGYKKWRREFFHPHGFVRCNQLLDHETDLPTTEFMYDVEGRIVLAKYYRIKDAKKELKHIDVFDTSGAVVEHFKTEEALMGYYLPTLLSDKEKDYLLILDRGSLYFDALNKAKTKLDPSITVKTVPMIHAVHVADAKDIGNSRTNNYYTEVLAHIEELDALVVLTDEQGKDIVRRYGDGNIKVIPHAYDPPAEFEAPVTRNPKEVVYVARYAAEKKHDMAVKAFAMVLKDVPDAILNLYGSGGKKKEIEELIEKLNIGKNVKVHGFQHDVSGIFERAGLSLLTSTSESFALSVMESLAHGCPVVAFDVPYGPQALIDNGQTGFLVPYGSIENLAAKITYLLKNPDIQATMSNNARQAMDVFSMQHVAKDWDLLIGELFDEHK